jgi:hypothetical protein
MRTLLLPAWVASCLAFSLIGCSHKTTLGMVAPPTSQRGALLSPPMMVATYSTGDLLSLVGANDLGKVLLQLAVMPTCSITVFHLEYQTVDPAGNLTPASGALMVPSGANCPRHYGGSKL